MRGERGVLGAGDVERVRWKGAGVQGAQGKGGRPVAAAASIFKIWAATRRQVKLPALSKWRAPSTALHRPPVRTLTDPPPDPAPIGEPPQPYTISSG